MDISTSFALREVHLTDCANYFDQKVRRNAMPPWRRQIAQRLRSLTGVAHKRRRDDYCGEICDQHGWLIVVCNLVSVRYKRVTADAIQDMAASLVYRPLKLQVPTLS